MHLTLVENGDVPAGSKDTIGLLFECAPDSDIFQSNRKVFGVGALLGKFSDLKAQAHALSQRLLADEPKLRGIPQLGIFEENVIMELQAALALQRLHDKLCQIGATTVSFSGPAPSSLGFQRLAAQRGTLDVITSAAGSQSDDTAVQRAVQRLRREGLSATVAKDIAISIINRLDPFRRRNTLRSTTKTWKTNQIWFYTTAYTFTQAGLGYEPYFPEPFVYLIEDQRTGGRALLDRSRSGVDLYDFARPEHAPSAHDIATARRTIAQHIQSKQLTDEEREAVDIFLASPFMARFWSRHLPEGLFASALFESWVQRTRPKALVTGNYVFEGYAMHTARRHGIPVITLQHGLFIDYCQFIVPEADAFLVRGQFWRDFLAVEARKQALVLNPPAAAATDKQQTAEPKNGIVFLTAPYILPYFNEAEIDSILATMIAAAQEAGAPLTIRVHPLDSLAAYKQRMQRLAGSSAIKVTYSQGGSMDEVLTGARVAVTYFSTVFQDCLRHGVPLVALGWHDFAPKAGMAALGVFLFADTLADLKRLTVAGARGQLQSNRSSLEMFLHPTTGAEMKSTIAALVKNKEHAIAR